MNEKVYLCNQGPRGKPKKFADKIHKRSIAFNMHDECTIQKMNDLAIGILHLLENMVKICDFKLVLSS